MTVAAKVIATERGPRPRYLQSMSRNVLVPFDGAAQSESALRYAIASFPGATITALYVVDLIGDATLDAAPIDDQRDELERRGREILDRAEFIGEDADASVETVLEVGVPHRNVIDYATDQAVDHVVIGGHGRSSTPHPFLGKVSETVVLRSPVTMTVVPLNSTEFESYDPAGQVLVPVDGSPQSTAALEYAVARFPDADVTALHVVGLPFEYSTDELAGSAFERFLSGLTERGESVLESTIDDAALDGTAVETELTYGKPPQSIVDFATAGGFDQVVMGFHGRSRASRFLTGSVAETVARRASVPLTLIRDGRE